MSKIQNIKMMVTRATGRTGLLAKKYSPEILMGVGIVGVITSTVMACKATIKAEEVLEDAKYKLEKIHEAKETVDVEKYSEQTYRRDLAVTYFQSGIGFVKVYGPAITLGVASIGCILGAHGIMKKRNVALLAAYKAVEQNFSTYRNRVIEEFGEEKDFQYRTGVYSTTETVIEKDENGKKVKVEKTTTRLDPTKTSQYSRFFDDVTSTEWKKSPEYNLTFVTCQQNYANEILKAKKHIFLNEVYDMLGMPRSKAGQIVGWAIDENGKSVTGGDGYVDFGIYRPENDDFVNGHERSILLDFNVDGIVYDLIEIEE